MNNRFKKLRTEANLSQAALAEKLHVHQTAVSQWELNKSFPEIDALKQMSDIYGVSIDYLVGNVNDPFFVLDNKSILDDINSYENQNDAPSLQAVAAHFDLNKLTDEGIKRYNEYVQYLTERFSKE